MSTPVSYSNLALLIRAAAKVCPRTADRRIKEMLDAGQVTKDPFNGLYYLNEEAKPAPAKVPPLKPSEAPPGVPDRANAEPLLSPVAKLFEFFVSKGVTPNYAAAAVGNVYHSAARANLS